MKRVLVGMSGGVDSSVTAYLLREKGYEVHGLSFMLWEARNRKNFKTCCSLQMIDDAAKTAEKLGINHHVLDVRGEFLDKVIEPFVEEYKKGRTPNPCILCNRYIKFPFLINEADRMGIDFIATGHYANRDQVLTFDIKNSNDQQISKNRKSYVKCKDLTPILKKGIDNKKDQTYFLYVLTIGEIERLLLRLGKFTKNRVREIAYKLDLPAALKTESQEICFVEDRDYQKFIKNFINDLNISGPIKDINSITIGKHNGLFAYTIGQRKGLGISYKEPLYVIKIDTENNTLYVGSRNHAMKREFSISEINWTVPYKEILLDIEDDHSVRVNVKFRSTMNEQPAKIYVKDTQNVKVEFDEPQWAPAGGQSAVFYNDDIVLGGGVIVL